MTEQQPPLVPPGFGPPPPQYAPSAPDAPEFLAVDKHSSVVVDFTWPEIRSVHYRASPDGKALMVAVVHVDGRVYEAVVNAKPRELLRGWFAQLARVLGYYRPAG